MCFLYINLFISLLCIKVLKFSYQKINNLRDSLYFMSKCARIKNKISHNLLIFFISTSILLYTEIIKGIILYKKNYIILFKK